MKFSKASLIAGAVLTALVFSGCAVVDEIEEDEEIAEIPEVTHEFRAIEAVGGLFALASADGDKATTVELNGVFSAVGQCLGVSGTEQGDLTVVWPSDTLVLNQKTGVEFRSNDWEGDPVRTRLNLNDPVVIAGDFVTDASWFDDIPEGCAIPEGGVFVISNAHHPAPPPEEEAPAEDES